MTFNLFFYLASIVRPTVDMIARPMDAVNWSGGEWNNDIEVDRYLEK
jgi:hypothetical protein